MSLVGSIFGSSDEKPAGLTSLFDESSELPGKPQHKPLPPRKKKRKDTPSEEVQQSESKKKRKQRKPAKEETSATAEQSESDNKTAEDESPEDNAEERTVFVGNLLIDTTRKSLASIFKSCGKVESCRLRSVAAAGVKLPTERAGDQVRLYC